MVITILFNQGSQHSIAMILQVPLWVPTITLLCATLAPAIFSIGLYKQLKHSHEL